MDSRCSLAGKVGRCAAGSMSFPAVAWKGAKWSIFGFLDLMIKGGRNRPGVHWTHAVIIYDILNSPEIGRF
jgi:hypothetical protein